MKANTIFILFTLVFFSIASAKNLIRADERIQELNARSVEYVKNFPPQGFRITAFSQSGNFSRNACLQARTAFGEVYPLTETYVVYEEPYFKMKVGNYRTRLQAQAFLDQIKMDYPQAYIVKDNLDIKALFPIPVEEIPIEVESEMFLEE